jgi:hypothetical protein
VSHRPFDLVHSDV